MKYFSLIDRAGFQGAIRKKRASRSDGQRRLKIEPLEARMLLSASPTIHFDKLPPSTIYDSQDTVRLEWHAEDVDGDLYSDGGTLSSPTGGHPYSSGSTYFTTPIYKGKMHSINVNMVWCMNKYGLGKYTLEVDAEDRAGHIRTASRSFTIEDDDTDGPEIALTNANDQFDGDDNTVSWSITDESDISYSYASVAMVEPHYEFLGYSYDSSGAFDLTNAPPGRYRLYAYAADNDSDRNYDTSSSYIYQYFDIDDDDTAAPVIVLSGSSDSEDDGQTQEFTWDVTDDTDLSTVSVVITKDGTEIHTSADASGSFNFDDEGLGTYVITVDATDSDSDWAGDELSSSASQSVVVHDDDVTAPLITLGGSSGTEDDGQTQQFTWDVTDDTGPSTVSVSITKDGSVIHTSTDASGDFNFDEEGLGTYVITVDATDADTDWAGDQLSSSASQSVVVDDDDVVAPTITVSQGTGEFAWTVSDIGDPDSVDSGLGEVIVTITQDTGSGPVVVHTETVTEVSGGENVEGSFVFRTLGPGQFALAVQATDGDDDWVGDSLFSSTSIAATGVGMDIKYGSDPNSINLGSNGVLPLILFSTSLADGDAVDFDVTDIDLATILFGDPNAGGTVAPIRSALEDVDHDGDLDLVLHFAMEEIRDDLALNADSVDAVLTAQTFDGADLVAMDAVRIVPPKGKGKGKK